VTVASPVESGVLDGRVRPAAELRRSPLQDRRAEFAARRVDGPRGVGLGEEPFLTQVDLRTSPDGPALDRVERALDLALPRSPNRATGDDQRAALWLGPDEWLVVAPDGNAHQVLIAGREALADAPGSVVDVSSNRTTLRLSGPMAREVLEKVCSLDLHPRSFGPGRCAQTLVGRAQVVLWQVATEPAYRLMVRCSFADYLADLLLDAMEEFTGRP
jgi:sarcosine oxidase subunit gamma